MDDTLAPAPPLILRDDDEQITPAYVAAVAAAIEAKDLERLRELVGDLHEADSADLLEALDADQRPELIELMGDDFDFAALTDDKLAAWIEANRHKIGTI